MMLLFLCTASSLRETKKLCRWQAVSVHHLPALEIERVEVDSKMGPQCSFLETRRRSESLFHGVAVFFFFVCFVPWHMAELLVWVVFFLLFFYCTTFPRPGSPAGLAGHRWASTDVVTWACWMISGSIQCPSMWYRFAWFELPSVIVLRDFEGIVVFTVKLELSSTSLDFSWVGRCRE